MHIYEPIRPGRQSGDRHFTLLNQENDAKLHRVIRVIRVLRVG